MPDTPALMPTVHPNRLNRRRAIMTNDPRRLNGIDMRTSAGRRYRDIVDQLASEFGAVNPIALRELAGLHRPVLLFRRPIGRVLGSLWMAVSEQILGLSRLC
jgi:hypothetical protein